MDRAMVLPKARPISCNDSPAFQRRQISVFCAEERPYRLPTLINTTSKTNDLCRMVLHPPVELARIFGKLPARRSACMELKLQRRSGFSSGVHGRECSDCQQNGCVVMPGNRSE